MFTRHLGKFNNYEAVLAALEAGTLVKPYVALDVSSNVSSLVLPEGDIPVYINYRRGIPVKLVDTITLEDYYCANSPYLNAKINLPLVFDYVGNYTPAVRVIDKAWFIKRMTEDELTSDELVALCFGGSEEYVRNEFNYLSPVPENFTFERPVTWLSGKGFNNDGYTSSAGDDLPVPCYDSSLRPLGGDGTDRQGYYIILAAFLDPETGLPAQDLTFKVGEYRMQPYLTSDASLVAYGMQFSLRAYWWEDEEQTLLGSWYAVPQNTIYDKAKFLMYWAEDYSTPAEAMVGSAGAVVEYDLSPQTNFYFGNDGWNLSNGGETTLHARIAVQLYNTTSGVTSDVFGYAGPDVPGQGEEPIPDASGTHVYQIYNLMQHSNDGFYDSSVYVDGSTRVEFYGNVLANGYYTHGIFENSSVEIATNPGYYGSEFRIFTAGSEYYFDRGSEENCYRINGGENDGEMHTCEFGNFYIKVDGTTVAQETAFDDSNSQALYSRVPLGIFGVYADGQATPADGSVNLGYFKIYEGETLVRDFVPAVNDSSAVGLLDKVNYKFYPNQVQGQGVVSEHLGFISVTTDASGNVIDTSTDITGNTTNTYQIYDMISHNNDGFYDSSAYVTPNTVVIFNGNVLNDGDITHGIIEYASVPIGEEHPGIYGTQFRLFGYGNEYYYDRGSVQHQSRIKGGTNDGSMHVCEYGNYYINIDGQSAAITNTVPSDDANAAYSRVPLGIFGAYDKAEIKKANGLVNLKSFKIYDGSTLVRDFVPAVNDSSVVGLLDRVSYQFFENQVEGEGALTEHRGFISVTTDASGNVVDTSTDLITTGYKFTLGEGNAAYFNSGYVPNTDTVVQFKGVLKKSPNGRGYGLETATQGNYCMAFFGYHYPYDNTVYFEREGYNNVCESLADVDSSTHEYEFGNCYINVDGNQLGYGNTISSTNDTDTEFYIFALGDVENGGIKSGLAPAGSELEYIKFLEPDGDGGLELMMDLRPALDADNNPCLLDMVNGDLIHTSGGTPVITVTALEEEE